MNLENEYWAGCYSGNFDLWTPESYAHPAKGSPALFFKIIEHLEELHLIKPGDTICDPMSGIGTTAICANAKGYRAVTIELEEKFCNFQRANKEYAGRKLGKELDWQIIQGDSRKLSELLSERGLVTVSSPPYGEALKDTGATRLKTRVGIGHASDYSNDASNIGNLPDRPLTVTSPPYIGNVSASDSDPHPEKQRSAPAGRQYGNSPGQIAEENPETYLSAMRQVYAEIAKVSDVCVVVTKNPTRGGKLRLLNEDTEKLLIEAGFNILCRHKAVLFEEHETQDLFGNKTKKVKGRMSFFKRLSYQKGAPVAQFEDVIFAVKNGKSELVTVSSPPYCDAQSGGGIAKAMQGGDYNVTTNLPGNCYQPSEHGTTPGQIGNLKDK